MQGADLRGKTGMRIMVHGAAGRMGRELCAYLMREESTDELVGQVDVRADADGILPCLSAVTAEADVIVDFSHPIATSAVLSYACARRMPVVIATTGHTEEEQAYIRAASAVIPVFYSANLSLGMAFLCELAGQCAALFPFADAEIVETHHAQKADAPSGSALTLAKTIRAARAAGQIVMGRTGQGKREAGDIGIHAVRRGSVIGEHTVYFSTPTQTLTFTHTAHSRALFAEGALAAARFLQKKPPALYGMLDLLKISPTQNVSGGTQ